MKSTGIVRRMDELGRVVIPKELRNALDLGEGAALEVFVEGDRILLHKYEPGCIFCGEVDEVTEFKGKRICKKCLPEIVNHHLILLQEEEEETA